MMDGARTEAENIPALMADIGARAKAAAAELGYASAGTKARALEAAADAIEARADGILAANATDMAAAEAKNLTPAMLDRLKLDRARILAMAQGLREVAAQPDPVGRVLQTWERNGLRFRKVATPLGVVGVIYESRPNVTADAGGLCLKSGNAAILRGGSESFHSSAAIHACLQDGLRAAGLPEDAIQRVPTRDRDAVGEMLAMQGVIDVIVPRGGKGLVGRVQTDARVPVFAHLEGICHVYADRAADPEKARRVIVNAKTRRTGICGAAECLLLHKDFAAAHGAEVVRDLLDLGVEIRGDAAIQALDPRVVPAQESDWGQEYLDMILAARVVSDVDEAIAHIRRYGSQHTEAILTEDDATADRFFQRLDSAILLRNASTQFADGGEFGFGAEIGIATGKMHARGPVGADQLTSFKYLVEGDGAIRP